jgi:hypothetical protein
MRRQLVAICATALLALGAAAAPARGDFSDPLFLYVPVPEPVPGAKPVPPPTGYFNGPCGVGVDSAANIYVSDHYHDVVDVFGSAQQYKGQLASPDPLDGPCQTALDSANNLYVNDYHRAARAFSPFPAFGTGAEIAGAEADGTHPTGVAVNHASGDLYVNDRTYVARYEAPVTAGEAPVAKIGLGTLGDGYGLAVSRAPDTLGYLYVPDASDDTVKVYDPATDLVDPVQVIDGQATPNGGFVSLRDSAVAVDRLSGNVYVVDDLQPALTEEPQAIVHVFGSAGVYKGHLKYNVVDARPPGLAVDNSSGFTQGRVYVTTGNTTEAGVYGYPPNAATVTAPISPSLVLTLAATGSGQGSIAAEPAGIECSGGCQLPLRAGRQVSLSAVPDPGSQFVGWSGGGCSGKGECTVTMSEATSVRAGFAATEGSSSSPAGERASVSEVIQRNGVRVRVKGSLSPRRLPRHGTAPISVSISWKVSTDNGSPAPKLRRVAIAINRHGHMDSTGLPTCPQQRIYPASSARALANCRQALVGRGNFTAEVALRGQEAYPANGRLLIFNGRRGDRDVLLGHIYSAHPFPISFVIVFELRSLRRGAYGMELAASMPKALASWGNLTAVEMTLGRRYRHRGRAHSFISAGCPALAGFSQALFPLARPSFAFAGGQRLGLTVVSRCRVGARGST